MSHEPYANQRVSWAVLLVPAGSAGLLGLALNLWLPVNLYRHVELVFGAVPVLMAALAFGWRGGGVAAAIAGLGTYVLWGHGLGWALYTVEAMVVGALATRLHPAMVVLAFWLVVGLPAFWVSWRLNLPGFAPSAVAAAFKTPLQELFAALLAYTLLFLAPLRRLISDRWPFAQLPRVSMARFQITFLALGMLAIAGSMLLVEARSLYAFQRQTLGQYNQTAAFSVASRLESQLSGMAHGVEAMAASGWSGVSAAERERAAHRLLRPGAFVAIVWLDPQYRVRAGWFVDDAGRHVPIPVGADLSRYRAVGPALSQGVIAQRFYPSGQLRKRPFVMLHAPGAEGGFVAGALDVADIERAVQAATPLVDTTVQIVGPTGQVLMRATPNRPVPGPAAPVAFPGLPAPGADLVNEAPVAGTDWRVRVITPEPVVRRQVDRALRNVAPTLLPVLLLLAALGVSLMVVMGQEFRQLRAAAQRIGHVAHAEPGLPDSFLVEFRGLYDTFDRVSRSLRQAMQALRTREAELSISNSQLAATVDELRAVETSRGEVLNAISHDIKIPLTAIVGYTELLEDGLAGPLSADQKTYVQGIEENSERVIRLLEDLLDLTRLEVGRFPIDVLPLALDEVLGRTQRNLQPLIDRKGLHMTGEAAPGLQEVLADPARLDQVLNNLVSNAIKFTPAGGHIALRAYPAQGGHMAVCQVIDDGPGIPPEHLPNLFDRFYRVPGAGAGGTGLGLAISKGLVEAMGGQIGVISEPGKGSTFWFTLPFVAAAVYAENASASPGPPAVPDTPA